eukprot:3252861-Alexandrium_andersonii.AAC.1
MPARRGTRPARAWRAPSSRGKAAHAQDALAAENSTNRTIPTGDDPAWARCTLRGPRPHVTPSGGRATPVAICPHTYAAI